MKDDTQAPDTLLLVNVSRRHFLKGLAASSAVVLAARWDLVQAESDKNKAYGADAMPHGWVDNPNVFIALSDTGEVTITHHRGEMGQGIRTSLVMVIADEMGADWKKVRVEQAIGHEEKYGNQNTDGSRSMRHWFDPLRRAGAAMRMMLEQAAAQQWQVPVAECQTDVHRVVHQPTQRSLSFGELAATATQLPVPDRQTLTTKNPEQWRYMMRQPKEFKSTQKQQPLAVDGWDIVQGKALFAADVFYDDMLYAVIARPPSYGTSVGSIDDKAALQVPGVIKVISMPTPRQPSGFEPLGGVAVIAENTWAAIKGRKALKIEWDNSSAGDNASYDSKAYRTTLEQRAHTKGKVVRKVGDFTEAQKNAAQKHKANYYAAHMAQAPMEPMAAVVKIDGDRAEVWTSIQNPQAARDGLAKRLGLKPLNVTVRCGLMGGGFGRKAKPDYVYEAADLSKAMNGRPVRVQWTREDDLQHSYFHTVALEHMEGTLDKQGDVTGWLHRSLAPTMSATFGPDPEHQSDLELGQGIRNMPFQFPVIQQETGEAEAHVRIGWFRSVYNIPHAFAIQSFMAELASKAGKDHKQFLLEQLGADRQINPDKQKVVWNYGEDPNRYPIDIERCRDVIEKATEEAGWGKDMPANRGLGLAFHNSFVSYCAVVADVEVTPSGSVIIHRLDMAFDCGPQINPDRVQAQIEGAGVMGTGIALMTEITASEGKIEQDNFHRYLVPRINEAPKAIHVYQVNNRLDLPPGGVGEPGLPPVAPAICNAIYAATGKRIRTLPIGNQLAS